MFNNSLVPVKVTLNDRKLLSSYTNVEISFYNRLVSAFGAQFNRDSTFFLGLSPVHVELLIDMVMNAKTDITGKVIPTTLSKHTTLIEEMSPMARYLFSTVSGRPALLPNTIYRMVTTIMKFYRAQAEIRQKNFNNGLTDISFSAPVDSLPLIDNFDKRNLQVDRKDCNVTVDKKTQTVTVTIPYMKTPIVLHGKQFVNGWNYIVLTPDEAMTSENLVWNAQFQTRKNDVYLTKRLERHGRSGVFEQGKSKYK